MIAKGIGALLLHLFQDLVFASLLDQAIVPHRLLHADPREEEDEEQHPGDRDVVRLQEDVEELSHEFRSYRATVRESTEAALALASPCGRR
jgi:hypothetical protein